MGLLLRQSSLFGLNIRLAGVPTLAKQVGTSNSFCAKRCSYVPMFLLNMYMYLYRGYRGVWGAVGKVCKEGRNDGNIGTASLTAFACHRPTVSP